MTSYAEGACALLVSSFPAPFLGQTPVAALSASCCRQDVQEQGSGACCTCTVHAHHGDEWTQHRGVPLMGASSMAVGHAVPLICLMRSSAPHNDTPQALKGAHDAMCSTANTQFVAFVTSGGAAAHATSLQLHHICPGAVMLHAT